MCGHVAALETVILNLKLVVNPGVEPDELYLRPGQWIPWMGVTVLGTMVALSGVMLVLHLKEKVHLLRSLTSCPLWINLCVAYYLFLFCALGAGSDRDVRTKAR